MFRHDHRRMITFIEHREYLACPAAGDLGQPFAIVHKLHPGGIVLV